MLKVKCPTCGKEGDWLAGNHGPFCSQRCRLIDLSKWFGEEHRFSEPLRPEHFKDYEDLPSGEHLDQPDSDERKQD
jgi:endogenous inhibitor of DNA gyrase (YacG/DUF329 family)